ncbi:HNH endonuclease [Halobacteria archaeon AArc-curdl1]|uniref:HNH endonuclease n=1 Tax=Natronosalvus hydrolyticus TaxID=2979988 RepID=A0AAP3E7J5_9EURY|nr:HNH endonuclease [Halobacteria archaeon AArc-curdl1]
MEDSSISRITYRKLQAYREGVNVDDLQLDSPDTLEQVKAQRARIQNELADAEEEIKGTRDRLRNEIVEQLRDILGHVSETEDTSKSQIIALKETLESDLRSDLIADAIGCSSGYPGKFQWQEQTQSVVLPEGVEKRRKNRFSESQKTKIRRRDDHQCIKCSSGSELHVHHIIPIDSGGDNEIQNGATLCKPCHNRLHRWNSGFGEDYSTITEFWTWAEK